MIDEWSEILSWVCVVACVDRVIIMMADSTTAILLKRVNGGDR